MNNKICILILDDDPCVISLVSSYLLNHAMIVEGFTTPEKAIQFLDSPAGSQVKFAIVDLFLEGDQGDFLSNDFVKGILTKREISYCRLTSAPLLVPKELGGVEILDKRKVLRDLSLLLDIINAVCPDEETKKI